MSLKATIENHPVILFGAALLAGFVAGFGTYQAALSATDRVAIPRQQEQALREEVARLQQLEQSQRLELTRLRKEFADATAAQSRPSRYVFKVGYWEKVGADWIEYRNGQADGVATFKEAKVDDTYIYLADAARVAPDVLYLRIPIRGGEVHFSHASQPNTWYHLTIARLGR